MPIWLIALMAILWGSSQRLPTKKRVKAIAKWCRGYDPHTLNKKHLDRLIEEATGERTGLGADPELSGRLLADLAHECPEIAVYLRTRPELQQNPVFKAGMAEPGKYHRESALPAGTRHTTYLAEERQRKAEREAEHAAAGQSEDREKAIPDVEIVSVDERELERQRLELEQLAAKRRR